MHAATFEVEGAGGEVPTGNPKFRIGNDEAPASTGPPKRAPAGGSWFRRLCGHRQLREGVFAEERLRPEQLHLLEQITFLTVREIAQIDELFGLMRELSSQIGEKREMRTTPAAERTASGSPRAATAAATVHQEPCLNIKQLRRLPEFSQNVFLQRLVRVFSKTGDENLTLFELIDLYSAMSLRATTDWKAWVCFCVFDHDEDGVLNVDDLHKTLRQMIVSTERRSEPLTRTQACLVIQKHWHGTRVRTKMTGALTEDGADALLPAWSRLREELGEEDDPSQILWKKHWFRLGRTLSPVELFVAKLVSGYSGIKAASMDFRQYRTAMKQNRVFDWNFTVSITDARKLDHRLHGSRLERATKRDMTANMRMHKFVTGKGGDYLDDDHPAHPPAENMEEFVEIPGDDTGEDTFNNPLSSVHDATKHGDALPASSDSRRSTWTEKDTLKKAIDHLDSVLAKRFNDKVLPEESLLKTIKPFGEIGQGEQSLRPPPIETRLGWVGLDMTMLRMLTDESEAIQTQAEMGGHSDDRAWGAEGVEGMLQQFDLTHRNPFVLQIAERMQQYVSAFHLGLWGTSLAYIDQKYGHGAAELARIMKWMLMLNMALTAVWLINVILPRYYSGQNESIGIDLTQQFFYSGYVQKQRFYGEQNPFFHMDVMYLGSIVITIIGSLMAMLHKLGNHTLQLNIVKVDSGGDQGVVWTAVLAQYDWSQQDGKSAFNMRSSIRSRVEEWNSDRQEALKTKEMENAGVLARFAHRGRAYLGQILTVLLVIGVAVTWREMLSNEESLKSYHALLPSMTLSAMNAASPPVIKFIVSLEERMRAIERLQVLVQRIYLFKVLQLAILFYSSVRILRVQFEGADMFGGSGSTGATDHLQSLPRDSSLGTGCEQRFPALDNSHMTSTCDLPEGEVTAEDHTGTVFLELLITDSVAFIGVNYALLLLANIGFPKFWVWRSTIRHYDADGGVEDTGYRLRSRQMKHKHHVHSLNLMSIFKGHKKDLSWKANSLTTMWYKLKPHRSRERSKESLITLLLELFLEHAVLVWQEDGADSNRFANIGKTVQRWQENIVKHQEKKRTRLQGMDVTKLYQKALAWGLIRDAGDDSGVGVSIQLQKWIKQSQTGELILDESVKDELVDIILRGGEPGDLGHGEAWDQRPTGPNAMARELTPDATTQYNSEFLQHFNSCVEILEKFTKELERLPLKLGDAAESATQAKQAGEAEYIDDVNTPESLQSRTDELPHHRVRRRCGRGYTTQVSAGAAVTDVKSAIENILKHHIGYPEHSFRIKRLMPMHRIRDVLMCLPQSQLREMLIAAKQFSEEEVLELHEMNGENQQNSTEDRTAVNYVDGQVAARAARAIQRASLRTHVGGADAWYDHKFFLNGSVTEWLQSIYVPIIEDESGEQSDAPRIATEFQKLNGKVVEAIKKGFEQRNIRTVGEMLEARLSDSDFRNMYKNGTVRLPKPILKALRDAQGDWVDVTESVRKKRWIAGKRTEFDYEESASVIIGMLWRQTFVWSGTPFCPALPLLACVSQVACFYALKHAMLHGRYTTPQQPWAAGETRSIFMHYGMITLLGCVVPTTVWLNGQPACGPHSTLPSVISAFSAYESEYLLPWLGSQLPDFTQDVNTASFMIHYVLSSTFLIVIAVVLWTRGSIRRIKLHKTEAQVEQLQRQADLDAGYMKMRLRESRKRESGGDTVKMKEGLADEQRRLSQFIVGMMGSDMKQTSKVKDSTTAAANDKQTLSKIRTQVWALDESVEKGMFLLPETESSNERHHFPIVWVVEDNSLPRCTSFTLRLNERVMHGPLLFKHSDLQAVDDSAPIELGFDVPHRMSPAWAEDEENADKWNVAVTATRAQKSGGACGKMGSAFTYSCTVRRTGGAEVQELRETNEAFQESARRFKTDSEFRADRGAQAKHGKSDPLQISKEELQTFQVADRRQLDTFNEDGEKTTDAEQHAVDEAHFAQDKTKEQIEAAALKRHKASQAGARRRWIVHIRDWREKVGQYHESSGAPTSSGMLVEYGVELYEVSRTKAVKYTKTDSHGKTHDVTKPVERLLSSSHQCYSTFTNMHAALCSCLPLHARRKLPNPPSRQSSVSTWMGKLGGEMHNTRRFLDGRKVQLEKYLNAILVCDEVDAQQNPYFLAMVGLLVDKPVHSSLVHREASKFRSTKLRTVAPSPSGRFSKSMATNDDHSRVNGVEALYNALPEDQKQAVLQDLRDRVARAADV